MTKRPSHWPGRAGSSRATQSAARFSGARAGASPASPPPPVISNRDYVAGLSGVSEAGGSAGLSDDFDASAEAWSEEDGRVIVLYASHASASATAVSNRAQR